MHMVDVEKYINLLTSDYYVNFKISLIKKNFSE